MKNFLLSLFGISVVITLAAFGQSRLDVITLKSGEMYKGEIIENVPNDYVKIQIDGGSTFTVKYSDIAKFSKEKVVQEQPEHLQSATPQNVPGLNVTGSGRNEGLEQIEKELVQAQSDHNTATMTGLGGFALAVYGYYGAPPGTMAQVFFYGGAAIEIWGLIDFFSTQSRISDLEAKRKSLTIRPVLTPNPDGSLSLGVAVHIDF